MKQITLISVFPKEKSPCKSKMFGLPDVLEPDEFEVPTYNCCGHDFDMTFMCQINCSDVKEFDKEDLLPEDGMLYFFYNMAMMPSTPNVKDAAAVIYADTLGEETFEFELLSEEGEDVSSPEIDIEFCQEEVDEPLGFIFPEDEEFDELGDEFEDEDDAEETEDVILLQLSSFETEELCVDFKGGSLLFLINKEKLKNRDFSDIRVMIV